MILLRATTTSFLLLSVGGRVCVWRGVAVVEIYQHGGQDCDVQPSATAVLSVLP